MSLTQFTQRDFEVAARDLAYRLVLDAQHGIERRIRASGHVLTQHLLDSLNAEATILSDQLYAEFRLSFAGYGRFKDMRKLVFRQMPPIEVLEEFVAKKGVSSFKYVPGYLTDAAATPLPSARAQSRIAWGIGKAMVARGLFTRKSRGFYNVEKAKLVNEMRQQMLRRLPEDLLANLTRQVQGLQPLE